MLNGNSNEGDKKVKKFTPLIQRNMKITGANNPDILLGIKNGNQDLYSWAPFKDFINIDLQDEYYAKAIKLCLWHYDDRYYTYDCWVSKDSYNWNELFTEYHAKCNDTIIIMDSIRFIRLKGKNNKNEELHIVNFKII